MRRVLLITRTSVVVVSFAALASWALAEDSHAAGRAVFDSEKCATCHSVEAAGIESKVKSSKLQGPDLGGVTERVERAWIEKYLHKQVELNGELHKKEFTGTDEELAALIDWLATMPKAEASGTASWTPQKPADDVSVRADR